jgi:hypothetical protein
MPGRVSREVETVGAFVSMSRFVVLGRALLIGVHRFTAQVLLSIAPGVEVPFSGGATRLTEHVKWTL